MQNLIKFTKLSEKKNVTVINMPEEYFLKGEFAFREDDLVELSNGFSFTNLYCIDSFHTGWLVLKDNKPLYAIHIYEPHGFGKDLKNKLIVFHGHEEIITFFYETGDWKRFYTR